MLWMIRFAMVTMFPRHGDLPGIEDTGLDAFLVRYRRDAPFLMWLGLIVGSLLFMILPIVTVGLPVLACFLPRSLRERHARKALTLGVYPLRQLVYIVKMVGGLCWGAHPDVRRRFALAPYPEDPGSWKAR